MAIGQYISPCRRVAAIVALFVPSGAIALTIAWSLHRAPHHRFTDEELQWLLFVRASGQPQPDGSARRLRRARIDEADLIRQMGGHVVSWIGDTVFLDIPGGVPIALDLRPNSSVNSGSGQLFDFRIDLPF